MADEIDCFFRKEIENEHFALRHAWAMGGIWRIYEPAACFVGQQPTSPLIPVGWRQQRRLRTCRRILLLARGGRIGFQSLAAKERRDRAEQVFQSLSRHHTHPLPATIMRYYAY